MMDDMGTSAEVRSISGGPAGASEALSLLDAAVGAAASVVAVADTVGRRIGAGARPVAGVARRVPVVSSLHVPLGRLSELARRGEQRRGDLLRTVSSLLDSVVPLVAEALLRRVDLTEVVKQHVDLDEVVASVDLDHAAARLDVDAVAKRIDLDAVVDRLDLNRIVRDRVDLDGLVADVDLDAVAARLDLDAVINRIDLAGLARDVIAEIDLPEIIRESTGSVASETVRGVRMQGISADEAIGRSVDRFRLRHGRKASVPGLPDDQGSVPASPNAGADPTARP
jgi:hypothetical protein